MFVFDAVVLGSLDECEGVGDVVEEQALVFQCPNLCSRDPFCPGDLTGVRTCRSSGWRMMNSSKFSDRNGPPLSVTLVSTGGSSPVSSLTGQVLTSGCPNMRSWSVRASSIAVIASCWFAVGEICQGCSYCEYQSRHPAIRQIPPEVVSNSDKIQLPHPVQGRSEASRTQL